MDIPYTVQPRPDTGLYNAKLGIWLFLASEVMLFGGLVFRLRAAARRRRRQWPHGWLNIPLGTANTVLSRSRPSPRCSRGSRARCGPVRQIQIFPRLHLLLALTFPRHQILRISRQMDSLRNHAGQRQIRRRPSDRKIRDFDLAKKTGSVTLHGRLRGGPGGGPDGFAPARSPAHPARGNHHPRRRHQENGKLRPVAQHLHGDLFHADRPARAAHPRRRARHRLISGGRAAGCGRPTRTLHQPHRGFRPVLAFRGFGLDFPVSCLI
jgi:hypothetical protein